MTVIRLVPLACLLAFLQAFSGPGMTADDCCADTGGATAMRYSESAADPFTSDTQSGVIVIAGSGFACGPDLVCESATQICSVVIGGPEGVPPGYDCVDVPEAAPSPTCESIPDIGIGCECDDSGFGVTVTCTAP